ncbi:hypothetical protein AVEN_257529-1 [Araneus ventricosus]|uniref:Retrotransposon gag domain-containing protein n=1 Tax=Araneus ventricosus TaxID=182803 RepID=A0A4Y2U8T1_ARAVE|nr:hypothetical protein AVEN_257529-1 [Araneus ventricosus]
MKCDSPLEMWPRIGKDGCSNFMLASEKNSKPENVKIAILLNLFGDEDVAIYNTFKNTEGEQLEEVLQCFEEHCNPHQNVVFQRYKFFSCKQREGQTFDNYLTQLKTLVITCDFGNQQESLIRDRIVLGINDSSLQERMPREHSLALQKAAEFVRAAEASKEQFQSLKGFASSSCVSAVKHRCLKRTIKRTNPVGRLMTVKSVDVIIKRVTALRIVKHAQSAKRKIDSQSAVERKIFKNLNIKIIIVNCSLNLCQ